MVVSGHVTSQPTRRARCWLSPRDAVANDANAAQALDIKVQRLPGVGAFVAVRSDARLREYLLRCFAAVPRLSTPPLAHAAPTKAVPEQGVRSHTFAMYARRLRFVRTAGLVMLASMLCDVYPFTQSGS